MKHITTFTHRFLNEAIKTVSYATSKSRVDLGAIHFYTRDDITYMCATDGIAFASLEIPSREQFDPFGVDVVLLKQACDVMKDTLKGMSSSEIEIIRHDDYLHVHPEGRDDLAFAMSVATEWHAYTFLFSHQHAAVVADITCADVAAALKTTGANDLCITYRRGNGAASSWATISARSEDGAWSDLIDLPARGTVSLSEDVEIMKLFAQRSYLLNAVKRAGKTARLELIVAWPTRAGGVRIVGDNGGMHVIVAMNDTTRGSKNQNRQK